MKKHFLFLLFSFCTAVSFSQNLNLYPDSLHAPFIYGVASGNPTDSSLIIWTALANDSTNTPQNIIWQLATDSNFASIIKSDSLTIDSAHGYTAKIDVNGLQPFNKYFYRFSNHGSWSITGFTETAPMQAVDSLKFALVSCSSLFSGYFNAYRQIAWNSSINAVIHVGDNVYDFVDPQERVRVPQPEPTIPNSLDTWRERYRLYMLDPDQREARRMHPWIQIWDNHELKKNTVGMCSEAFFDFNPVRKSSADSTRIWRKLSYGPLVDIFMTDDWQYAGRDSFTDGGKKMIPDDQFYWLLNGLDSSTAVWKVLAVSKLFCPWDFGAYTSLLPGLNNSWQAYPESRDSLLTHIAQHHINNPVIISGDLHMNVVSDLVLNPYDSTTYSRATGAGGLGVEVNGNSISRGNLDVSPIPLSAAPIVDSLSLNLNPQQRYLNLFDHGYSLLTFNHDSLITRFNLCPILQLTNTQVTDTVLFCRSNDNHWLRVSRTTGISEATDEPWLMIYPNPTLSDVWQIKTDNSLVGATLEVRNQTGQLVFTKTIAEADDTFHFNADAGIYFVRVIKGNCVYVKKVVKL